MAAPENRDREDAGLWLDDSCNDLRNNMAGAVFPNRQTVSKQSAEQISGAWSLTGKTRIALVSETAFRFKAPPQLP